MQELHEKIERSLLKIFVTVFCLILLLGLGGYFSLTAFRAWQVRRLLAEANALVNEGNYNHASLDARRVLELDPESVDAMRVIARSAESAGLRSGAGGGVLCGAISADRNKKDKTNPPERAHAG